MSLDHSFNQGQCGKSMFDASWALCKRHDRCRKSLDDVDWAICRLRAVHAYHILRRLVVVQDKGDAGMQISMIAMLCEQLTADATAPCSTSTEWCTIATNDAVGIDKCSLDDVAWILYMMHAQKIEAFADAGFCDRRWYQPVDVHKLWPIRGGLGICCLSKANVTCHMRTCHIRAYRTWMIPHSICQHCLGDTHIPWLFLHDSVEAPWHWSMFLDRYTHVTLDACISLLIRPFFFPTSTNHCM